MIAASEPLEFIPRGRQTATEHPDVNEHKPVQFSAENLLLNRLKNVHLSSDNSSSSEFWCIEDVNRDFGKPDECIQSTAQVDDEICKSDEEHELYVKGCVAVWTKGAYDANKRKKLPLTCFTVRSPIRFAFFCPSTFFKSPNPDKRNEKQRKTFLDFDRKIIENSPKFGICLIDSETLRVYSQCGEDFRSSFPFLVANVFQTKYGLLLEKNASMASIDGVLTLAMPRFYSLSHPLHDICPILLKSLNGHISLITDERISIAFTLTENNLVMIHDARIGKHILCKLRKATHDEKQKVGGLMEPDIFSSDFNLSNVDLHTTSSVRFDGSGLSFKHRNSSIRNRSSLDASSLHASKLFNMTPNAQSIRSKLSLSLEKSQIQTPYDRLQSPSDNHSTFVEEEPRLGCSKPSKPIVPELLLESVWIESIGTRDFPDVATRGFLHCDFIGQKFICYLLKRTGILMMYRSEKSNSPDIPTVGKSSSIPAKDAICISALKVVAILAHCGSLILYSGSVMIGKVDIGGITIGRQPQLLHSAQSTVPRRSSLLPTAPTESSFDDEVHLLSPVYPLQSQYNLRSSSCSVSCSSLRDVCGSRITLQYSNDTMYRISLPPLSECALVTKCIIVLRSILKRDMAISIISKWYSIRNTRGSQDISFESEWLTFQNFLLNTMGRTFISMRTSTSGINMAGSSRSSIGESKKRRKTDDPVGSDHDFQYLISKLNKTNIDSRKSNKSKRRIDTNSTLALYIPMIFFSFHLLYEELKFDETLKMQRAMLAEFLHQLAIDLQLDSYCLHYFLDCPDLALMHSSNTIAELDRTILYDVQCLSIKIPSIYGIINDLFSVDEKQFTQYPYIPNVNPISKQLIDLIALVTSEGLIDGTYQFNAVKSKDQPMEVNRSKLSDEEIRSKALEQLVAINISRKEMSRFPSAIHFLIAEIMESCRLAVPPVYDARAFGLIYRPELYSNTLSDPTKDISSKKHNSFKMENALTLRGQTASESATNVCANSDGMAHIYTKLIRLRFPKDLRIEDVRQMLASSTPVLVDIVQRLGVSDHDFIEERERQLLAICTRTMSLPVGRGMLTLHTISPAATEPFDIPKMCLTGKDKEKGALIEMNTIEVPTNMNVWPLFHNGVAAGLQLTSDSKNIDSAWIVYNKPKSQNECSTEHAGFLLALGLTGHLKILSPMSLYDYLVKCEEMTNLGILIGVSAAHRGSMDNATTKLLSIHIEALLPPTALELDISQNVQIAAIMGIGLLYQGTAKRHIAEMLVQEIGRPPGPEMENCVERESYALTSGLALGLVTLGRGESAPGLTDLRLPDMLHRYMTGGRRDTLIGPQKDKYKFQSFQVREGEAVNVDVTAPGATFALGLMFIRTGNKSVASWMDPPDTHAVLDHVRPDLLLIRVIARGLILWDDIEPTNEWLRSQFPTWLQVDLHRVPITIDESVADHESFAQAYCNITAGAAFCLGLRYAGTQNEEATAILDQIFKLFLNSGSMYLTECAGKPTIETCLMLVLLASSLVMAGSGDLKVVRRCRMLRNRLGVGYSHVTYGSHMAVHMAIGFQFMGAGRFTLSRSPEAIAALICALFPKFPIHSNDNRYHLQAFRHLYVLAIEPRIVLPRDIDTGKLCPCNITYLTLDGKSYTKMAPCMLPELNDLAEVRFEDPNYWKIKFIKGCNWEDFERIIRKCNCVDIKQKAGCVSHIDDPTNLRSTFAYTLSTERYVCWRTHPLNLLAFTNNSKVQNFINKFLTSEDELSEDSKFLQLFMLQFYHCLTKDTMHALYIYVDLLSSYFRLIVSPESFDVWQLKLMQTIVKYRPSNLILSAEHLNALVKRVETLIENKITDYAGYLQQFLYAPNISFLYTLEDKKKLRNIAALIQFLGIPINIINQINVGENQVQMDYLRLIMEMKRVNVNTVDTLIITKILNTPGF